MMMIVTKLVEWELAGETNYLEKTCPSANLYNINYTWPDLGSNLDSRGGKQATNRLSYGTAKACKIRKIFASSNTLK
jgi:hypothetical protein